VLYQHREISAANETEEKDLLKTFFLAGLLEYPSALDVVVYNVVLPKRFILSLSLPP
jgi:hypothetical protein